MIKRTASLAAKMLEAENRPSGFDYMRLALSVSVICMHSVSSSYGDARANAIFGNSYVILPFRLILPMFFALSGFLVSGSLERCRTLVSFLGLRVIRIYPALAVEVALSALIIGPLVTTVPLKVYFTSAAFWEYLANVTGHIHYFLPGVFLSNPKPAIVNGQLWTVPYELSCYLALTGLVIIGAKRKRIIVPVVAVLTAILITILEIPHFGIMAISLGPALVISYLSGVSLYLYRDEVPWSFPIFLIAFGTAVFGLCVGPFGGYLTALVSGYVTVFLGLCNPRRADVIRGADYSYGIYLYGFVIQQLVMELLPMMRHWYWNIAISVPLAALFAAFSWHLIEKPALGLRTVVKNVENYFIRRRSDFKSRNAKYQ